MIVNTQELNVMLTRLSRIMPKRSPLTTETCFGLWADDGRLYGYAVNTGEGMSVRLDIRCEGEFPAVVVENTLGKVMPYLRNETVELTLSEDSRVVCEAGDSVSRHATTLEHMPRIHCDDIQPRGTISATEFAMIAGGVAQLASANDPVPLMRAALVRNGFVSATDRFSAARVFCPELDKDVAAFPPATAFLEFSRAGVDAAVAASDAAMIFTGEGIEMRTLQLDVMRATDIAAFFQQQSSKFVSEINAAEFVNALNAAAIFTENAVTLEISPEELVVAAGEYRARLACHSNTSDVLMFDVKRLLQASRSFFKEVEFSFDSPQKPMLFRGKCEYAMMGMQK